MGKEATEARLVIGDLRGGRNGTEPPLTLPEQQCVEALNVDWSNASLAHKRYGASDAALANSFTGVISFLGRHVSTNDEQLAELWAIDDASPPLVQLQPTGSPFLTIPLPDPITGNAWDVQATSFQKKYFLAYDSGVPRLHVFDPQISAVRRTGLIAPGAVTAANTGVGTYPAVPRYYRVRAAYQFGSSGITTRLSEPGPSGLASPSGTGTGVLVTFPATVGEGQTHWVLEASLDDAAYFVLQTVPIATLSVTDSVLTTNYVDYPLSAASGEYSLQKSYRFLAVDNNRVLGFGSFTSTDPQHRLEFSGVAGSTNISDEERVPIGNYLDFDDEDSGEATGLIGPIFGAFFVFKYRQVWKLIPTGNATQPYVIYPISKVIGAIHQNAIDVGEDATGNPVVYFMSARGPYRLGLNGLQYIGLPIEDLLFGPTLTINLRAAKLVSHGAYYTQKRQWWVWYAASSADEPNTKLIYDVRRSAWARHDGPSAHARCSLMFSRTTNPRSLDLKPYIGQSDGAARIWKCDDEGVTADAGTPFQAYVLTKPYVLGGLGAYCTIAQGTITAAAAFVTVSQTIIRDFGKETQVSSTSLSPTASETRVQAAFAAGGLGGGWAFQFQIGDLEAVSNNWTLDAVTVNYLKDQAVM